MAFSVLEGEVGNEERRVRKGESRAVMEMLRGLGARLSALEAPFDPEHGAYDQHHGHDHGHHHDYDHG